MNTYDCEVDFESGKIYLNTLELVVNDYNSTTFNFTFNKEGRKVFKLLYPDNTYYVDEIKDNTLTLGKGILYIEGTYRFEVANYGEDNRLTTAKTSSFIVRKELVSTDEIVAPDDRVPILDRLINEVEKIIDATIDGSLINYLGQLTSYSEDSPIDITKLREGIYMLEYNPAIEETENDVYAYFKATYKGNEVVGNTMLCMGVYVSCSHPIYLEIINPVSDDLEEGTIVGFISWTERSSAQGYDHYDTRKIKITSEGIDLSEGYTQSLDNLMNTNTMQTIDGEKTFNVLPKSEVTPTSDNELVTKKYVDERIEKAIQETLGGSY